MMMAAEAALLAFGVVNTWSTRNAAVLTIGRSSASAVCWSAVIPPAPIVYPPIALCPSGETSQSANRCAGAGFAWRVDLQVQQNDIVSVQEAQVAFIDFHAAL